MNKEYIGSESTTTAGTQFTFSGLNIGTESENRKILVAFFLRTGDKHNALATSILLNNIEADILYNVADGQGDLSIVAITNIPIGNNLNATLNVGGSYLRCAMQVYRLDNAELVDCQGKVDSSSGKVSLEVNSVENGIDIGFAVVQYSNASVNTQFTGLTKDGIEDIPYVSTCCGSGTTNSSTTSLSASFSRTTNPKQFIVLSFKKYVPETEDSFGKIQKNSLLYNKLIKDNIEFNKIMLNNELYWKKQESIPSDTTPPVYTALRIMGGIRNAADNTYYANSTHNVTIYVNFGEKLFIKPKAKIGTKEWELSSEAPSGTGYMYYRAIPASELENGLVNFEVYGYSDEAGNIGRTLTNADITLSSQSRVIVDKVAPVININGDTTVELSQGSTYNELGAEVTDNIDATLEIQPSYVNKYTLDGSFIQRVTEVDTNSTGRYNVVYTYTDKAGNQASSKTKIVWVR